MKTRKNKRCVLFETKNKSLLENFHNYQAKNIEIMYHITTLENGKKIMKEGFDPTKSRTKAFGEGVNFTNNLDEVYTYKTKLNNFVIISLVKYNKKKLNSSNIENMVMGENEYGKFGYSKPKYMHPPKGYDALYSGNIFVIPNKNQIYPIYAFCV